MALSLLRKLSDHVLNILYSLVCANLLVSIRAVVACLLDWLFFLALVQKLLLQVRPAHYLPVVAIFSRRLLILVADLQAVVDLRHQVSSKLASSRLNS